MLIDPALSRLPAFLTPRPGLNSGFMVPQVTAAALVAENRQRATPASVDSIPTSANQEDHVSMSAHAARRLLPMADNVAAILGIELLAAAQGCDFHAPLNRARSWNECAPWCVAEVPHLEEDREIARRTSPRRWRWCVRADSPRSRRELAKRIAGRRHGTDQQLRTIRSPHGSEITAKSWLTEAPMRMLMNNLDPEVAERPGDLIVYGGMGRAARDWDSYDRIVATLRRLEADQTLLVQSGKPVGVFRTHEDAPRVLIANSNLVPHWATWEHFNELDRKGLMMFGQMTAGSWIYIGSQGIIQGTYETFVEIGRRHYGGSLVGTLDPDCGPRRHGRRAAAGGNHGGRVAAGDRMPAEPHRDAAAHRLSRSAAPTTWTRRWRSSNAHAASGNRCRSDCSATRPRYCRNCCAAACGRTW